MWRRTTLALCGASDDVCTVWSERASERASALFYFLLREKYTWPGSNWRPSACWADVIATRPQVPLNDAILDISAKTPVGCFEANAIKQKTYTWPGSNWRPSACEADVIATRPQVLCQSRHQYYPIAIAPGCLTDERIQIRKDAPREARTPDLEVNSLTL